MKSALRPVSAIGARPVSGRPRPQGVPRVVGPVNIPSIKVAPTPYLAPFSASRGYSRVSYFVILYDFLKSSAG